MKCLKLNLNANDGFLKNSTCNLNDTYKTYPHVHFVMLPGLFGAMLGLKGNNYTYRYERGITPQYMRELKGLQIAVVPKRYQFESQFVKYNNTSGFANKAKDNSICVQNITEEWLVNPSWDIYILEGHKYYNELKRRLFEGDFVYDIYIGRRSHGAFVEDVQELDVEEITDDCFIDSFFLESEFEVKFGRNTRNNKNPITFNYELPLKMIEEMNNMRDIRTFNLTNLVVKNVGDNKIYKCKEKNIVFY